MPVKDLQQKVLETLKKYKMIEPGDTVLVALSGGPDSIALTCLLKDLANDLGITIFAAHLNHGLRGAEADADAKHATEFAKSLNIPITVKKADVLTYKERHKLSVEMAAREIRYHFLLETARAVKANKIATGHTANDQAEEVLLNLVRGAGLTGLAGIPPVREKIFIRPLIRCLKDELLDYLHEKRIPYRIDSTNLDTTYLRNRLRHKVFPLLEDINPRVIRTLSKTSDLVRDEEEFWDSYIEEIFDKISAIYQKSNAIIIEIPQMIRYHISVQRRIVRYAIKKLKKRIWGIGFDRIEDILKICHKDKPGGAIELHGNIVVEAQGNKLLIHENLPGDRSVFDIEIPSVGKYTIDEPLEATLSLEYSTLQSINYMHLGKYEAVVDADRVKFPLKIRSVRPGDRFTPLGLEGSKKLQDFFVDEKIPRYLRPHIPIVTDREKIIWVVGYRIDDRVKVTKQTKKIIFMKWEEK